MCGPEAKRRRPINQTLQGKWKGEWDGRVEGIDWQIPLSTDVVGWGKWKWPPHHPPAHSTSSAPYRCAWSSVLLRDDVTRVECLLVLPLISCRVMAPAAAVPHRPYFLQDSA